MTDRDDLVRRNIMDGDPFMASTPSWRFRKSEVEPYMPSQAPGELQMRDAGSAEWSALPSAPSAPDPCRLGFHHHDMRAGTPWFKVRKISKEQYKELIDANREAGTEGGGALSSGDEESRKRGSTKDRIDNAW